MVEGFQLIVFLPSVGDALAKRGVSPSRSLEADILHQLQQAGGRASKALFPGSAWEREYSGSASY